MRENLASSFLFSSLHSFFSRSFLESSGTKAGS
nr:MAG TPA: hypothetical protein [Caudoviricetes sp.]